MKKIINKPEDVVKECLMGLQMANSDTLEYIPEKEVIYRKNMDKKVAVISGGGAGHEPLHAGFVGKGMLDRYGTGYGGNGRNPGRKCCCKR